MKFLYFTDTHIRGISPQNRLDNFLETLKIKFKEIIEISNNENVDYILHGGDWFDRPDISPSIVREFAKIISEFKKDIYSVAGNHDLYGQNPKTVDRTMLGILEGVGLIKLLSFGDDVILEKDNIRVQLNGSPYSYDIDGEEFEKYYVIKKRENINYAINIVHGMLLKSPFFEGIKYTLLGDILHTQADVTLAGHYHSGFGIQKINNKYFVNPGSLVRINNSISEINRKPKVTIIDINNEILIKEIELKSTIDGNEILDKTIIEESTKRNMTFDNFYKSIVNTDLYGKINIQKIIDQISDDKKLSKKVRDEAIKRIGIADEEINIGGVDY